MKADVAVRARIAGVKAVASYLARLLSTGLAPGLDVARCLNPYEAPYRRAWFEGFDEAVERFKAEPPAGGTFAQRLEHETWAGRRAIKVDRRRTAGAGAAALAG